MTYTKKIAKTYEGREFMHSREKCYYISAASASEICTALNTARYDLKPGEVWHIYDVSAGDRMYIFRAVKKRGGHIYITDIDI